MPAPEERFAFVNREFVRLNQAYLHVSDLAIQRGYGIFDYFKVSQSHPYFLDDYLARFAASAGQMDLKIPLEKQDLKESIHTLMLRNKLPESGIKMILTGGYSPDGYHPAAPNLIITQHDFSLPTPDQYKHGIKIISHEYVREIPTAKTINYTMGIRLIQELKHKGADDVLYHKNGVVSEFPRCNFFIVKQNNTVVTPARDVLPGITRKNVLALAREHYPTEEGEISLNDILQAKEAFLTSTTKRILPIVHIDGKIIGKGQPGEITKGLLQDLIALEEQDRARA